MEWNIKSTYEIYFISKDVFIILFICSLKSLNQIQMNS